MQKLYNNIQIVLYLANFEPRFCDYPDDFFKFLLRGDVIGNFMRIHSVLKDLLKNENSSSYEQISLKFTYFSSNSTHMCKYEILYLGPYGIRKKHVEVLST